GMACLCIVVAGTWAALPSQRSAWPHDLPLRAGGLSFMIAGLLAWARSSFPRAGQLMVVCGVSIFAADLRSSPTTAVFALGFFLAYLYIAVVAQLFVSFPAAWPPHRTERAVVAFCYCAAVGSQVVRYVVDHPQPPWTWGQGGPNTPAATAGSLLASAIVVLVAGLLFRRWQRASPPTRRQLAVLWVAILASGVFGVLTAFASVMVAPQTVQVFLGGGIAVVGASLPFAFLAGLL